MDASDESNEVAALYHAVLDCWNRRTAGGFAALFAEKGNMVGFDGSQVDGRAEIAGHLAPIFEHHPTAAYVAIVREVRFLRPDAALLRAVAGMVPPGQTDINPAVNTIHTMAATRHDGKWQIEMFQSTPAASHGRPEASEALTGELRAALRSR
jgi:uncharacterized protein (TIGR02246 family)